MSSRMRDIIFQSFLDNVTLGALFGKLRWPGSPTELIDHRSPLEYERDLDRQPQSRIRQRIQARIRGSASWDSPDRDV